MHTATNRTRILNERLQELTRRARVVEGDLRAARDQDWVERATESENDDVLEELGDQARAEVERIRHALRRIEDGHGETCESCQRLIDGVRLEALPSTVVCVGCANTADA
jgi:DnaK suppressor protein